MANLGLRTLMFGMKELSKSVSKETMPDTKFLEKDLTLLGATGLEDLLQDNVA
jgi:magnesium-transporting ATPase (P-type)